MGAGAPVGFWEVGADPQPAAIPPWYEWVVQVQLVWVHNGTHKEVFMISIFWALVDRRP